jgi:hypothetical protein
MLYMGIAITAFGVGRLAAAVLGTMRLDRQVAQLDYFGQAIRSREIEDAIATNRWGFYWALVALSLGPILIHAATH